LEQQYVYVNLIQIPKAEQNMKKSKPDKPKTEKQKPDASSNSVWKTINTFINKMIRHKKEEQPNNNRHATYERTNIKLLADILFVTCAYTIFACLQWISLKNQLEETTREFHASHRPWCAIPEIETIKPISFESGKVTGSIRFTIKNGGNAPALKVNKFVGINVGTLQEVFEVSQHEENIPSNEIYFGTVVMPKVFGFIILPGENIRQEPIDISEFSHQDITQFQNKKIGVYLKITTVYRDEFDVRHYTVQRWQYIADGKGNIFEPATNIEGHWAATGIGTIAK
jgi:hypothetical protein